MRYLAALLAALLLASPAIAEERPSPAYPFAERTGYTQESRLEPLFTHVASTLASPLNKPQIAKRVPVYCWSNTDWNWLHEYDKRRGGDGVRHLAGYVVQRKHIQLSPAVCERLARFSYRERKLPKNHEQLLVLARRIGTLAHEPLHARSDMDEIVADLQSKGLREGEEAVVACWSMQLIPAVARFLVPRLTPREAARLARAFWGTYWAKDANQTQREYTSEQCYDGKLLDLSPGTRQGWWH